jgi:germination protein M
MDNKKIVLIILIFVIFISVVGCKGKGGFKKLFSKEEEIEIIRSDENKFEVTEDDHMRKTVLYFKDKQELLVPVMRKIPWEEGIAKLAIKNMIDSPELRENVAPTGLVPIIPAGTEIRGMSVNEENGLCKLDFSKEILNYETEKDEENLIKGVVYTLTEFQAIDEVQFLVDGEIIPTMKYGTNISSPFKREDINLVGELDNSRSKVVVYYKGNNLEKDYEYFVPITIPTLAPMPNIYTALETLFDGPPKELELSSNIPEGTNFHGVDIKEGTAYIDISFDHEMSSKDNEIFDNMLKNIGLTLSEFDEVEKVELLIDGENLISTIPAFANEY